MITRRVTPPRTMGGGSPASAPPPAPRPVDQAIMYKGHQIEAGSYSVGSVSWSPRAVVSVQTADGAWQRTPLYATSSAKFPTRHEADCKALDVARAWIDTALERQVPPQL
jgi:hypothetical protein